MFERFTEDARQVIVRAQHEARELGHDFIGTEHLLLGLLAEPEGAAGEVLEAAGLCYEDALADVLRLVGRGDGAKAGQIPFTPRAKKVLELSLREALSLGDNHIGPEHVLLGLVRENSGVAAGIFLEHGLDSEALRDAVCDRLPQRAHDPRSTRGRLGFRRARQWEYRVEDGLDPPRLDELGAEGWELVAVVPSGEGVQLVFKRPGRSSTWHEQRSA